MNEVIYIRTSTEEQHPENQIADCEKLTKEDPIILKEKQSAFKDKERPIFEDLKKSISRGEVTDLVVWDLDRIFRNRKNLTEFFEFCKIYKCKVHSFRQQWLEQLNSIPEPFNEIMHTLMLQIMGWLAEDESRKKSDRVKLAVRKKEGNPTKSYKGNKWGRPKTHTNKINFIIELRNQGLSYRQIEKRSGLSIGKISEILRSENLTKPTIEETPTNQGVQELNKK